MKKAKKPVLLLAALVIFIIVGTLIIINVTAMPEEATPKPTANAWSEPVQELSGRVRVEFEDLNPGLRHAVYLELRNHSLNPVAVINQPQIQAELFDSAGKAVGTVGFPISGPLPERQWVVIPGDASIDLRLDMQNVGLPTRESGMALLSVGGKMWGLRAGNYRLEVEAIFKKEEDAPPNQWVGQLKLPPVEVVVTPQMVAVN
jgi:hypothetical protein